MPPSNPFRYQLASNSTITVAGLVSGARTLLPGRGREATRRLAGLLTEAYSVSSVALTGSGTEALVLALRGAETLIESAPVVALPAYSCFDLASAAVRYAGRVRFYDLDPETLGPDPESLTEALTGGANVVVVAPLYGIPTDWDVIDPIVTRFRAIVIEDAAQGHGARWRGARLGGHGRLGVLSFGRGKGWTGGAGGALLIRSQGDAERLSAPLLSPAKLKDEFATAAKASAQWCLGRPSVYGIPRRLPGLSLGSTKYHEIGEPRDMPSWAASLLLHVAPAVELEHQDRWVIAQAYGETLRKVGVGTLLLVPSEGVAGYVRYPVLLEQGMASFADPARAFALGAAPGYPRPLPSLDVLRPLFADPTESPTRYGTASRLSDQLVTLPTHHLSMPGEREELIRLARGSGP